MVMNEQECSEVAMILESHPGGMQCDGSIEALTRMLNISECCRKMGRFELALIIADAISTQTNSYRAEIQTPLNEIRRRIRNSDTSGAVIETIPMPISTATEDPSLPPLLIRGWNFASAMIRWGGAGFPTRSKTEISKLLKICQSCEHLKEQHCQLCGCPCNENSQLRNKLALKSEKCPIGRW
jgi:hypothetical protein